MTDFTLQQIIYALVLGARWTVLLSLSAFILGGILGLVLMLGTISQRKWVKLPALGFIWLVQATPLLMQLFLIFFGPALFGKDVPAWMAACIALTLWSSAYLAEIWRGSVLAVQKGQTEAALSLAMLRGQALRYVVLPQAVRMALPPTAGFMVQIVKSTALASIVGFTELMKTGNILSNVTLDPFVVYGLVAIVYFCLCYPLSLVSRKMETVFDVTR
ncbi:amino acid ABC transporter permease [Nitratireductor soli]|uniref:amino acid ABC transporter permease n=1 Tax=Nitratireductor soli TaxID=1670619 RepID=UPI00065DDA02|nr:amino acid ABC transporter permease [Nitratireductor soli]